MTTTTKAVRDKTKEVQTKKEKIISLKEKHEKKFIDFGIQDPLFIPKLKYPCPEINNAMALNFFFSELNDGRDIYLEYVDRDYVSMDPTRTLYMLEYDPDFEKKYQQKTIEATGQNYYIVPESILIPIQYNVQENTIEDEFDDIPDPDNDLPINQLTIRDLAAIIWKKPISQKKFLNTIINTQNGEN